MTTTNIQENAFAGCNKLRDVIILNSISSIGQNAFSNCSMLSNVMFIGRTLSQISSLANYPWGISGEISSIIKSSLPDDFEEIVANNYDEQMHQVENSLENDTDEEIESFQLSDYQPDAEPEDDEQDEDLSSVEELFDTMLSGDNIEEITEPLSSPHDDIDLSAESYEPTREEINSLMVALSNYLGEKIMIQYQVDVFSNDSAMGEVYGSGLYDEGTYATISAIPTDGTSYVFRCWSDGNIDPIRDILVSSDIQLTASFESPVEYSVNVETNDPELGYVYVDGGAGLFTEGSYAYIGADVISPDAIFVQWSDGNTDQRRELLVSSDISLTAYFEMNVVEYNINLYSNDQEMGEVYGSGAYASGYLASIEAIPAEGCSFERWSDGNTDPMRQVLVSSDIELTAYFTN